MKKRFVRDSKSTNFTYEALEPRHLLTTFWSGYSPVHHLPQDGASTVLSNLEAAPEITQQPEHGELLFDINAGSLTYHPDEGFTGLDTFRLASSQFISNADGSIDQSTPYTMRVWDPVYAVQDWAHVRPGASTTINVLQNDYAFQQAGGNLDTFSFRSFAMSYFTWQQDVSDLNIVQVSSESAAAISISDDGRSLSYTPAAGFAGTDLVTYTIEDSSGHRSEAVVTFEVSDRNVDGRYFSSQAQWLQERVDGWLARHTGSLTNEYYGDQIFGTSIDPAIRFMPSVSFASIAEDVFSRDQVAGVQEGDIIKSGGDFLYYVTHGTSDDEYASYLSIVDVSDPGSPELLGTTGFTNQIHDIYLTENRVAVILKQDLRFDAVQFDYFQMPVDPSFDLLVLDISDAESPLEVYRTTIDGNYTDARLIGDELYVVSDAVGIGGPSPWQLFNDKTMPVPVSPGDYIDAILEMDNGFRLPMISVETDGVTESYSLDVDQIVNRDNTYSSTLITTFDLQSLSGVPVDMDLVETNHVQTVYVSNKAMYLFDGESVVKFSFTIETAGVDFAADGELQGRLLGQFAADEYEGYLRVAMTSRMGGTSDVQVFEQLDDSLVVVATLHDIAPGERIYATHFAGEQAFVVTFRQVDPLFVIDLSDHTDPRIAGELKIPGVSNYMQLIGDDLLLAVGRDANEITGQFGALQVSLFDVSDSNNPTLLDRYTFEGGRTTQTPLSPWVGSAPEHHAVTFDPSTRVLSLPIFSTESWNNNETVIFENDASAVSLFQVDRENGIRVAGQVDFEDQVLRTVIVGEHVVFLSGDELKTATRISPVEIIASMDLPRDFPGVMGIEEIASVEREVVLPPAEEEIEIPVEIAVEKEVTVRQLVTVKEFPVGLPAELPDETRADLPAELPAHFQNEVVNEVVKKELTAMSIQSSGERFELVVSATYEPIVSIRSKIELQQTLSTERDNHFSQLAPLSSSNQLLNRIYFGDSKTRFEVPTRTYQETSNLDLFFAGLDDNSEEKTIAGFVGAKVKMAQRS